VFSAPIDGVVWAPADGKGFPIDFIVDANVGDDPELIVELIRSNGEKAKELAVGLDRLNFWNVEFSTDVLILRNTSFSRCQQKLTCPSPCGHVSLSKVRMWFF
jgi:hypothetical protein